VRDQGQLLVDDGDPLLARLADGADAEVQFVAIVNDAAFIVAVRIDARQNFHQGRFAGAVFAAQPMNLAATNLDRYVVQRGDAGEAFRYIANIKNKVVAHCLLL
jgi:hypothetical protein